MVDGMVSNDSQTIAASDACEIDFLRHELRVSGLAVPLGGRAFAIIAILARAAGELVTKNELMDRVWPRQLVSDHTLHVHVAALRKALGLHRTILRTESGRGYRLLASWKMLDDLEVVPTNNPQPEDREIQVARSTNIPAAIGDLVGRVQAAQTVRDLISAYRIVTLAGPGGIGKTALAVHTARTLLADFPDGAWFVELASLSDPELVPSAVVAGIGLKLGDVVSAEAVARAIGTRKLLLVFDNCEHLVEAVAKLSELLVLSTNITLLVTSREPLRIQGEYVYRVPSLGLPATDSLELDQISRHSALALFVARAQEFGGDLRTLTRTPSAIAAIGRHLDGIPLAIELAAARAAVLGVEQVAAGLRDRFALLKSTRRTALPRHRTLRETLDWSYRLLTDAESQLLHRLGIFVAPFSLQDACGVAPDDMSPGEVADVVANLVAKSLVVGAGTSPAAQLRLLETTRLYARDRLTETGDLIEAARRHALNLLRTLPAPKAEHRPQALDCPIALHRRADEVHAALEWAFGPSGDVQIATALAIAAFPLWFKLFHMTVARDRAVQALSHVDPGTLQEMQVQIGYGLAIWYMTSETNNLEPTFARALELADRLGDASVRSQALWGLWAARRAKGDYRGALAMAQRYAEVARVANDAGAIHLGDRILGLTHHYLGAQAVAREFTGRALLHPRRIEPAASIGYQVETPVAMSTMLGRILWLQGFPDQAMIVARQAVDAGRRSGHVFPAFYALILAGLPVALWTGAMDEAVTRLQLLKELGSGDPSMDPWVRCFAGVIGMREGSERHALIAAFVEPRVDISGLRDLAALVSDAGSDLPAVESDVTEILWNTPEILRVSADLLLHRGGDDAASLAEAKLLQAINIAREQGALSWELRAAMSLARLRASQGQAAEGRALLAAVYGRFQEGFGSSDLVRARNLLQDPSSFARVTPAAGGSEVSDEGT